VVSIYPEPILNSFFSEFGNHLQRIFRQNKQGTPALIRALARWNNGAEESWYWFFGRSLTRARRRAENTAMSNRLPRRRVSQGGKDP
jgi:hypothetical protein